MGQFLYAENVVITGTSAVLNSTGWSAHPYNGTLRQVTITTGGVGSSGTTAWMASSTATTSSSGLPSTGFITFKSENTSAIFLKVAPPGAGGATYYPGTGGHTSSGGLTNSYSTGPFFTYPFPLADDRLVISTTDGVAASNGFCHTIRLIFEGSRY
jgi:hypothetical protein